MRLSEYASTQRTYGSRKLPRSVQQSIPIDRIYEDGTWRCGNVYSQMWSMPDINFTMSDEDNKAKILDLLGKVYMGVPSDCWLKICIVSQRMDEKSFRENVLLHRNLDGLDKWRVERNRRIRQCVQDAGNVVQHKYLILSTNKQNVTDVLTVAQVCEVTGYQRHTILKWCSKGLLKTILQTPKYMIPKVWLLEFVTSDFFNEISRKCGKHYVAIKEISSSRKAR